MEQMMYSKKTEKNFPCRIEYEDESIFCVLGDFDHEISVPLENLEQLLNFRHKQRIFRHPEKPECLECLVPEKNNISLYY